MPRNKSKTKIAAKADAAVETPVVAAPSGLTIPSTKINPAKINPTAADTKTRGGKAPEAKGISKDQEFHGIRNVFGVFPDPDDKRVRIGNVYYDLIQSPVNGAYVDRVIGWKEVAPAKEGDPYTFEPVYDPKDLTGKDASKIIGSDSYANDGGFVSTPAGKTFASTGDMAYMTTCEWADWIGPTDAGKWEVIIPLMYASSALKSARDQADLAKTYQEYLIQSDKDKWAKSIQLIDTELKAANLANKKAGTMWDDYIELYRPKQISFMEESFRGVSPDSEAARAGLTVQREADKGVAEAKRSMAGLGIDPLSARAQEVLARSYGPALAAAKAGAMTTARDRALATNFAKKQYAVGLITGMPSESAAVGAQGKVTGGTGLASDVGSGAASAGNLALGASQNANSAAGLGMGYMTSFQQGLSAIEKARAESSGLSIPINFGIDLGKKSVT